MRAVTIASGGPARRPAFVEAGLTAEMTLDWASVEAEWRALERNAAISPYQRFDWMRAFRQGCPDEVGDAAALVLRDGSGRAIMIMPLSLKRGAGVAIASGLGGRHVNYHLPIRRADVPVTGEALRAALREAGALLGADAFSFINVPTAWDGEPNPLAEGGRASPSDAYRLTLGPDPDAVLAGALSKDARKKLRQKEKYLQGIGPVSHRAARTGEEVRAFLEAFHDQKAARFRELGIPDPFAEEGTRRFLLKGALDGLGAGEPAIALHGLLAGERIVAVFGAAVDARRCSGMVISFDQAPAVARCSPGDLLVSHVIRAECLAGRRSFDLGVGEARYKNAFCPEAEPLVQVLIPVSLKGAVYARTRALAGSAKRAVKRSPRLMALATRLRAAAAF